MNSTLRHASLLAFLCVMASPDSLWAQPCDIIYVATTGNGANPGTEASPVASLSQAMALVSASRNTIRIANGSYNEASIINISNNLHIEGGYTIAGTTWTKSTAQTTTITFSGEETTGGVTHRVAFKANGVSGWGLQDLTIITTNVSGQDASGRGKSNYGVWINNCNNYIVSRCNITSGNAGVGNPGSTGSAGVNGDPGVMGNAGSCDGNCSSIFCSESAPGASSGSGGAGGGGTAAGAGNSSTTANTNPGSTGTGRNGGGGGAGGKGGGFSGGNAAVGGSNGGGSASLGQNGGIGAGGGEGDPGGDGTNGSAGSTGAVGAVGSAGPAGTHSGGFFIPGAQAGTGGNGTGGSGGAGGGGGGRQTCTVCNDGPGNGGSGGGGGGQAGTGGTGGMGGGGSFAIYRTNSNTGATISQNTLASGVAGSGGAGGAGGTGGAGGAGGARRTTCNGEIGEGGAGGNGGNGGNGGVGGVGATGVSAQLCTDGATSSPSGAIPATPTVTVTYGGCTNSEVAITKASGTWTLPAGASMINDLNSASSSYTTGSNSAIATFTNTGAQSITASPSTFNNYIYIQTSRALPTFAGTMNATVCEGDDFYMSTPTAGDQYEWVIFPASGNTAAPTAIFTAPVATWPSPVTGTTTNYRVRLRVHNACCGWSAPVYFSFQVAATATPPTGTGATVCAGETATISAVGSGAVTMNWYADPLGQILLQSSTGPNVSFTTPVVNQNTVFYVGEMVASCVGILEAVQVTVNPLPNIPSASSVEVCAGQTVTLSATGSGSGDLVFYNNAMAVVGTYPMSALAPTQSHNAGALAAGNYTFYASEDNGTCESNTTVIGVTVRALPAAPAASGTTICAGTSATLTATATGTAHWYSDAALTNLISSGSVFITPALAANTTYHVVQEDAFGCRSAATAVTVTVTPNPANPTGTGATICAGTTATLSAAGAGALTWYSDPLGTVSVGAGPMFTTPVLTQTTTYYVRAASGTCVSGLVPVTATVTPLPNSPSVVSPVNVCEGSNTIITATGDGSGDLVFYNSVMTVQSTYTMSVAAPLGTHNAGALAAGSYTFFVTEDGGLCESAPAAVSVSVNALPAAPVVTNAAICAGQTAILTATGSGVQWYSDAALTTLVGVGNSFTTPALNANTTYYTTQTNSNDCESLSAMATVTVTPNPANPTVTGATICFGNTATLSATGSNLTWYADPSGLVSVGTGASFTTPVLTTTTSYYVQDASGTCVSGLVPVTATVTPLPNSPSTLSPIVVCEGNSVVLTATGSGSGDMVFYNSTMTAIGTYVMTVGTPTQTHNAGALAAGAYTFFVTEDGGLCESTPAAVSVNVDALPAAPVVTNAAICAGQTAILTATGSGVQWYSDAALTTLVGVGNSFTTPALNANTTYYTTQTNSNDCESLSAMATVTVTPNPANPTVTGATVCFGNTATLSATGSNLTWYADALGLVSVGTGASFTTPVLTITTVYYVQDASGACVSGLVPVTATVTPLPNSPAALSPITVCEGDDVILTATGSGSGDMVFHDNAMAIIGTYPMTVGTPTQTHNAGALAAGAYTFFVTEDGGACESVVAAITVNVNALPAAPTSADVTICENNNTALVATGVGVQWYADAALTNMVGVGNTYMTPVLTATTSYYVIQTDANGCASAATMVTVTVNPAAAAPTVTGATICSGNTATLGASGAGSLTWYSDAAGTVSVATGTSYTTPILTQTTTYFVQDVIAGCVSPLTPVTATVTPLPNSPAVVSPVNVCAGSDAVVTGTGSGNGDLNFYDNAMTLLSNYTMSVAAPVGTHNAGALAVGTYTFFVAEADGVCESAPAAVSVVVNAAPAAPAAAGATVCEGETAVLSSASAGIIRWYSDAGMTNLLAVANTYTTPALSVSTDFYLSTEVAGCPSPAAMVTVTVNAAPAAPTVTNATVCAGSAATLSANGSGGTIEWYSDPTGLGLLGTGNTLNVGVASQTTNYYVREVSPAGCNGVMALATVSVDALPNPPAAGDIEVCGAATVTLSATGSGNGDIIFYDAANTVVGQGTMTVGSPTINVVLGSLPVGNYVYFASEDRGNCASANTPINVTVNPAPATPVVTNNTPVCEGDQLQLQASGLGGATYQWTGPNGFVSNNQSISISDVTAAQAGTYNVTMHIGGCASAPASTLVTVNAAPVLSGGVSNTSPVCEHDTVNISAPVVSGLSYLWTGPNGFSSTSPDIQITDVVEADHQGFYNLVVTDGLTGCASAPMATLVVVNALPSAGIAFNNGPLCENTDLELSVPTVFGANYLWSGPNGFSSFDQNPVIADVSNAEAGDYTVIVANGSCFTTLTTNVEVLSAPLTTIIPDTTVEQGTDLTLYATGGVIYQWSPGTFLDNTTVPTPVMSADQLGNFTYSVDIINIDGCREIEKVTVTVIEATFNPNDFQFVDLFTPNGDGLNDTWEIGDMTVFEPYTMQILSRGGLEVLRTENYNNDWDGTFKGKKLPDGTYWYILRTADREYKGAVTIKR